MRLCIFGPTMAGVAGGLSCLARSLLASFFSCLVRGACSGSSFLRARPMSPAATDFTSPPTAGAAFIPVCTKDMFVATSIEISAMAESIMTAPVEPR
ncbi:MAG: hypothetical protein ACE5GY_07870 [Thermodesulfobacteriota bacterium]